MQQTVIAAEIFDQDGVETLRFHVDETKQLAPLLDRLIDALGSAREGIEPPRILSDPKPGDVVKLIQGSRWVVGPDLQGRMLLSHSHPGFGWVTFAFEPDTIDLLVTQIRNVQEQLATPPKAVQ